MSKKRTDRFVTWLAVTWCFIAGHDKVHTVNTEVIGGLFGVAHVSRWFCLRCKKQVL